MDRTSFAIFSTPQFWNALVLLLVLALLPVGRSSEAGIAVGAVVGIALAWRERETLWRNSGVRLALLLFVCYWLPALLSAPAAIAPEKSWSTVAVLLRFLPFVVFACLALRDAAVWPRIVAGIAMVVVLWLLDAWVQIFTGYSLAGATDGNVALIASVPKDLTSKFQADKIIQQIAPIVGGKGGGRPEGARGAGKDASKIGDALAKARALMA